VNFHSILYRELLVCSKRATTYYARSIIAGIAGVVAVALVSLTVRGVVAPGQTGRYLLFTLAALGMALALIEGVLLTIDSISRERREGTLGLLFLSNLSGYDIVIGKAGGAGLRTLFALIAASPAPALTFLFGGVTLFEYFKVVLTLLNALFFALSLGLFISSFSGERKRRATIATVTLVWFLVAAPTAGIFLSSYSTTVAGPLLLSSPALPLLMLMMPPSVPGVFTFSLACSGFIGCGLLACAGYMVDRNWRHNAGSARGETTVRSERAESFSIANPVFELARRRGPSLRGFWTSCACAAFAALTILIFAPANLRLPGYACILWMLHFMLSINVASSASKAMAEDRNSGLLELLLTTPLDESSIASGHLLALKKKSAVAFAFLVSLGLFWFLLFSLQAKPGHLLLGGLAYVALLLSLLFEMSFSARVGLWKGLEAGSGSHGFRRTLGSVAFAGIAVFIFTAIVTLTVSPSLPRQILPAVALGAACVGLLTAALGLTTRGVIRLSDDLRIAAAVPHGVRKR
jgi:hypothetical protein